MPTTQRIPYRSHFTTTGGEQGTGCKEPADGNDGISQLCLLQAFRSLQFLVNRFQENHVP